MKKFLLPRLIPVIFVLLAAAGVTAAETYELKLGFRPGEVRRYNLEETLLLKSQIPGQGPLEIKSVIKAVLRQEVLRIDQEGTEMACRIEAWQRQNWANGESFAADPKERETLLGLRLRVKVTPQGEIRLLEPAQLPQGISLDTYAGDYSFLPSRPVALGEEWTKTLSYNLGVVTCPTTVKSRLEKIQPAGNRGLAQISQEFQQEVPEFSLPLTEASGQLTAAGRFIGAGQLLFDLEQGLVKEETHLIQGRLLTKVTSGEARLEIPMDLELTVIINLLP